MRLKLYLFGVLTILLSQSAMSQSNPDSALTATPYYFNQEIPVKAGKELTFIAYYFNQAVTSNYFPRSDFFQGQVIGRLFGRSTAHTSDTLTTNYVEQRLLPFFIYTPKLMDGKVTLRASFEIDWTWGDASYGSGGNQGAGFNADFVNIQTQNIEVEIVPAAGYAINFGLMRAFDSPYHPYRTTLDDLLTSGYRLMYWAGDAAGISGRKDFARGNISAGIYNLWENKIELKDDVWLSKIMGMYRFSPKFNLGGSVYYLNDKSNGKGGTSILGQGPKSLLTEYTGTYRFVFPEKDYISNIAWVGTFFDFNRNYAYSNHRFSGFANYNTGNIKGENNEIASVSGLGANLRYGFRYGKTSDDEVGFDYIFTTGDENGLEDKHYSGVITGNTWGAPGNLPISSGANILFPSGNVVNRYMPLVADISNMGFGLNAGTVRIKKAVVPHKLILSANGGIAFSQVKPDDGGFHLGTEANLGVIWKIKTFMELELRGAHVWLGDFYDDPYANGDNFVDADQRLNRRPTDPWTAFLAFKWLMF